MYPSAFL
jgi:transposase